MEMKLISLTADNFKGFRHLELRFDGKDAGIYGMNGTGKTSVYDAFTWLLFGKDSKGDSSFGIKPVIREGEHAGEVQDPAAITSVEAVLLADGTEIKLRRTYYEVWSAKRGSAEKTRDGHSSDYFWDDVPLKKNEFDRRVRELVPEEKFKLLTSLFYFSKTMPWRSRREVLFDVAHVLSDREIMEAEPRFAPLMNDMEKLSLDDYRKKLTAKRKGINRIREDVRARLDECQKTIADLSGIDFDGLERQLAEAQGCRSQIRLELDQAERDGRQGALETRLSAVRNDLMELENENKSYRIEQQQSHGLDEAVQVRQSLNAIRSQVNHLQSSLEYLRGRKKSLEGDVAAFRAEWNRINGEKFTGGVCPACGQALPKDKLEAAAAGFEKDKARRKSEAVEGANRSKFSLSLVQEDIEKQEQEVVEYLKQAEDLYARLQELESKPRAEIMDLEDYAVRKAELEAQYQGIRKELDRAKDCTANHIKGLNDDLARIDLELSKLNGELAKKAALEYVNLRMEELRETAAAASGEIDQLDKMLFLCDEFTRYKVKYIEESVNSKFSLVRFRLFREQINGGIEDCCDVLVHGAAVGDNLNTGTEFRAGVDIINTISNCYGIYVPLFIDGCESVTGPLDADTQTIRLVVSENDKELRCELQ